MPARSPHCLLLSGCLGWWVAVSRSQVSLETGRRHQVRSQLAHAGFPILGDALYGTTTAGTPSPSGPGSPGSHEWEALGGGVALHAAVLSLPHPVAGAAPVVVEAPVPATWRAALGRAFAGAAARALRECAARRRKELTGRQRASRR